MTSSQNEFVSNLKVVGTDRAELESLVIWSDGSGLAWDHQTFDQIEKTSGNIVIDLIPKYVYLNFNRTLKFILLLKYTYLVVFLRLSKQKFIHIHIFNILTDSSV